MLWATRMFDRTYRKSGGALPAEEDGRILRKADARWRELVAAQKPMELDARFAAELDRIVEAARAELLA